MVAASPGRSVYAGLLKDTRGLSRDAQKLREQWFGGLVLPPKADLLFELEMLLKGIACFGDPRNHPRGSEQEAIGARNFSTHLRCVREGLARASELAGALHAGGEGQAPSVPRCAPKGLSLSGSPELGLLTLKSDLIKQTVIVDGLLGLRHVPFRLFFACVSSIADGIARNPFFNPSRALEFCPEYDRIASAQMLEVLRGLENSRVQHFAVFTALSLFRMLRYLSLLNAMSAESADERCSDSLGFLILAALRNDIWALAEYVRAKVSAELAQELERDLMSVSAADIFARFDDLLLQGLRLQTQRETFASLVLSLRMEIRHIFLREIPSPGEAFVHPNPRAVLRHVVQRLRPALQNALLFLGRSLGGKLDEQAVFPAPESKLERLRRLRRDVWMFAQIIRAFSSKARHADAVVDRWTAASAFSFVRDFCSYFRALGYPLLWIADYPRAHAFMNAVRGLRSADLVDRERLETAILECENFYAFLTRLFDQISRREELEDIPFDRREAARTLRHYVTD